MRPTRTLLLLLCCAAIPLGAQAELLMVNGGSGIDGVFAPTTNTTLDTATQPGYDFSALMIPAGVTVTVTGPVPIQIRVCGDAVIDGILDGSGVAGGTSGNNMPGGTGGAGGPGAGAGGNGAADAMNPFNGAGQPGTGLNPGQPGIDSGAVGGSFTDPVGGGGGGGNATPGADGGPANSGITPSASGTGGPAGQPPCISGSGGGGGGADIDDAAMATSNDGGGGGGGGGGNITLHVGGQLTVNGSILAKGGDGGASSGNGGAGGGGSGGVIEIRATSFSNSGTIDATGGIGGVASQNNCGCSPGGDGGDGCIVLFVCNPGASLAGITPTPGVGSVMGTGPAVLTPQCSKATIGVCGNVGDNFQIVVASALGSPFIVPGFTYSFQLDPTDFLFTASFPVNNLAPVVTGLTGSVPATVVVDLGILFVPAGTSTTLYLQGVTSNGGVVSSVTNRFDVMVAY